MAKSHRDPIWELMGILFKPHPWHGLSVGTDSPNTVTCYIEIVPADTVKYEVDKLSGYLTIDRPQAFSNVCPALYGFVPRTYCADNLAAFTADRTGNKEIKGDGDPLDICVLTEKVISHGDLLVQAIPIGGLRMIDGEEADDKIVAVLKDDLTYGGCQDIEDCPGSVIERLKHYFLTYKQSPDSSQPACEIHSVYGRDEAHKIIRLTQQDYDIRFGDLEGILTNALRGPGGV